MNSKLISLFTALGVSVMATAQNVSGQMSLFSVILNTEEMKAEVINTLSNKMARIATEYGFGSVNYPERFVLSVGIDIISNSIAPTNPPRISKQICATFVIGDVVENKSFSSCSIETNGIGTSDTKAILSALNKISPSNTDLKTMVQRAQLLINDYYGSNLSRFLSNAKAMSMDGNYDGAISYLMSIPPVNDHCVSSCQDYATKLYTEKIDKEGYSYLSNAKAAWISEKTSKGAKEAVQQLKMINPHSNCFPEAIILWQEIEDKLDNDERDAKAMALQQYSDNIEMKKTQMENNQSLKKAIVDACKSVGKSFGENRPQNVTKIVRGWF